MIVPGHRADVRAPVAADLGLVADAADRDADELAAERARDRLAERRLADAGRADEAEDRPGDVALQLRDGEVLDDPLLHLLEVVVVLVEDRAAPARGRGCPRVVSFQGSVRIQSRYVRMTPYSAAAGGSFSSRDELALGRLAARPRAARARRAARAAPSTSACSRVALAELLLDRLQLLAQEVLALALLHLRLDLRLDLRAELEHLELAAEDRGDRRAAAPRRRPSRAAPASPRSSGASSRRRGARARSGRRRSRRRAASSSGRYGTSGDDPRRTGSGRCASAPRAPSSPRRTSGTSTNSPTR